MLKETGYQEKIEMVSPWLEEIIETVKKDLKNEHLKIDHRFRKKYFLGKAPARITAAEMAFAYRIDIKEGNIGLGEFIATRWILKHTEIYTFFETALKKMTEDFEALVELPIPFSEGLIKEGTQQFGAKKIYVFSVFNSVVFPPSIYAQLRSLAERSHG